MVWTFHSVPSKLGPPYGFVQKSGILWLGPEVIYLKARVSIPSKLGPPYGFVFKSLKFCDRDQEVFYLKAGVRAWTEV
jgi:hypothetical protein